MSSTQGEAFEIVDSSARSLAPYNQLSADSDLNVHLKNLMDQLGKVALPVAVRWLFCFEDDEMNEGGHCYKECVVERCSNSKTFWRLILKR